ncbi:MAG: VanZ family protein [Planctomycetes bacterium]|nr:VanZ family protein [Planctomycetota bacterium]
MTEPAWRMRLRAVSIRLRRLWALLALAEAALIFWSSGRTWNDDLPRLALDWSNFLHFLLYGGLGGLIHLALFREAPPRPALVPLLGATAFGLFDECHQALVPGRDFSVFDLVTDFAGAAFAVVLIDRLLRGGQYRPTWFRILVASLALGLASSFLLPAILPDW